jgi:geranylgeranyl diphosphate synthase type II
MLSDAAGPRGMVGGQALDIDAQNPNLDLLKEIHARKTGRLIKVSVEGAAVLCQAAPVQIAALATFGEELGLAFQLADDLQDFSADKPEKVSFASTLGIAPTMRHLEEASQDALAAIADFPAGADGLREMIRLNRERV